MRMVCTYKTYVQLIPKRYPSIYTIAKEEGGRVGGRWVEELCSSKALTCQPEDSQSVSQSTWLTGSLPVKYLILYAMTLDKHT